jgi:hypothetical protein
LHDLALDKLEDEARSRRARASATARPESVCRLVLHRRTGDELWLERARAFGMHAIGQVERERSAVGRGLYSLFTGDAGVALFLRHALDGEHRFPALGPFGARS